MNGFIGGRWSARVLGVVGLLVVALVPASAQAARTNTLEFKAHWSLFKEGMEVDVPLYYVETRAPDVDQSGLTNTRLRAVDANFGTAHSTILSFTPEPGFNCRNPYGSFDCDYLNQVKMSNGRSLLHFYVESTAGLPITVDNSGIVGRTEVLIGTVRVRVGPAITDPKNPNRKLVFDITLWDEPTLNSADITVWTSATGYKGVGYVPKQQMQWFSEPGMEGIAPGDGTKPTGPTCGVLTKSLTAATARTTAASRLVAARAKALKQATGANRARARLRHQQAVAALAKAKAAQAKAAAAAKPCTACTSATKSLTAATARTTAASRLVAARAKALKQATGANRARALLRHQQAVAALAKAKAAQAKAAAAAKKPCAVRVPSAR